ncbi:MAG TPA: molybdopterin cofactor-binding domain-containing protein, partial [Candidatus Dormibacteraeota bacterium]
CNSRSVVTNTTSTTAYRGAGRPEATAAVERAVDLFAAEIGMDPAEVRRVNLVPRDAFPYTTPVGTVYDSGDYAGALERLLEAADYAGLRAEQARRRGTGDARQLGIGLSVYVEITNGVPGGEYAGLEVRPDGSAVVRSGTSPHGQGHATAWAMLASDRLGIPMERIETVFNDTDLVRSGVGTFGSRSLQVGGMAVDQAAVVVLDRARRLLAELLEADPADVVVDAEAGRLHVAGSPAAGRSWAELAAVAVERGEPLAADVDFQPEGATFPFGAHLALVEVDTETGGVVLRRLVAVDDAGRIVSPLLAEGQRHGGIAQGAAQALLEEVLYDPEGNPVTSTFADYGMISAAELPSFELIPMETPTPLNELGVKGIGESGTIGAGPAVQNAVVDALSHLGVRHLDMPATPQRVWAALREARR